MTRLFTITGVVLLHTLLFVGCNGSEEGSGGPQLYVEVQPNATCVIRGASMPCTDAPFYLRTTLNMPLHTYIAVSAASRENATLAAMSPVIDNLKASGYHNVIGSIDARKFESSSK